MKTWENKVVKFIIILTLLLVITCSSTDSNSVTPYNNDPGALDKSIVLCGGSSQIRDTNSNHPNYMILKNGVKLQYANGISSYQRHTDLLGKLLLELFPLNAVVNYSGYMDNGICIPRSLVIENNCN